MVLTSSRIDLCLRAFRRRRVTATKGALDRPFVGYARELKRAIDFYAPLILRWIRALMLADDPVEHLRLPVLPSDCVRMIYARKWRAESQDRALRHAKWDPWDLPPLMDPWDLPALIENDALHSLCFGTLLLPVGQGDEAGSHWPTPPATRAFDDTIDPGPVKLGPHITTHPRSLYI